MLGDGTQKTFSRVLTWVLAIALLASLIAGIYIALNPPQTTEPYTEFYILGPNGDASEYPMNLSVRETGTVVTGISNHEHQTLAYTVAVMVENRTIDMRTVTVADEETREITIPFALERSGRFKLRFLLYKGHDVDLTTDPYRHLRLWVTISASDDREERVISPHQNQARPTTIDADPPHE